MPEKIKIPVELLNVSAMTLATVGTGDAPHAAVVYFASGEELDLYFFSESKSQHSQDINHNPNCAITIYPECMDWRDIRGLQLRGQVKKLPAGQEWQAAWELYVMKFPFVSKLEAIVRRNALYHFSPEWVRLVDNRRWFGYKKEWNLK